MTAPNPTFTLAHSDYQIDLENHPDGSLDIEVSGVVAVGETNQEVTIYMTLQSDDIEDLVRFLSGDPSPAAKA